jgi:uncharacterized lipoprotein YddW (UPF0748 family)
MKVRLLIAAVAALLTGPLAAGPSAVLVDDFPTAFDWKPLWLSDLAEIGIAPQVVSSASASLDTLVGADLVLWNCGNTTSDPLNETERDLISGYLDSGGNVLISAASAPGELVRTGARPWLTDRLGCDYVMPNSPITWSSIYAGHSLAGTEGSLLGGVGFDLTFGHEAQVAADDLNLIHTTDDRASHLVDFTDLPGHLGVARETPKDRTILLTFPLESVQPATARSTILQRCAEWLTRPRNEGRGIWVVRNQLTDPGNIDHLVDACADAGFNTLFVQVRGRGDAYYNSATEPRSDALAGQPLDYDPLQRCIDHGHARGLQVHAWLNAGYVWGPGDLPTDPKHVLNRHPEWAMVNRAGKSLLDYTPQEFDAQYSEGRFLSLAAPEVQDYIVDVFMEVAENYDVDGLHFDFIRSTTRGVSPEYDLDYNPLTVAAFSQEAGFDPHSVEIDSAPYEQWLQWQRERIGTLVGRVTEGAHALRPNLRVSAAVLSRYHLARVQALQDWVEWGRRGQLDTLCLMAYSSDNDLVVQEALLAQENRGQATLWVGMGASHPIDSIVDRIERVRRVVNPEGVMFFAWGGFDSGELTRLRADPFVAPATVPPLEPQGDSSSRLSWR